MLRANIPVTRVLTVGGLLMLLTIGVWGFFTRLLVAVADRVAATLRQHKRIRNAILTVGAVAIIVAVTISITPTSFHLKENATPIALLVAVAMLTLIIPALAATTEMTIGNLLGDPESYLLGQQLEGLARERRSIEERIDEKATDDEDTVRRSEGLLDASLELNLNQLKEYYVINKTQARASFMVGVTAVVLGLVTILVGVGLLYIANGQKGRIEVAAITAVAGLLGQFIGGSCFYLFNKAQDQSTHYYDRLTELQGTLLAVRLAGAITDIKLADETRQQIVTALVESKVSKKAGTKKARSQKRASRRNSENGTPPVHNIDGRKSA